MDPVQVTFNVYVYIFSLHPLFNHYHHLCYQRIRTSLQEQKRTLICVVMVLIQFCAGLSFILYPPKCFESLQDKFLPTFSEKKKLLNVTCFLWFVASNICSGWTRMRFHNRFWKLFETLLLLFSCLQGRQTKAENGQYKLNIINRELLVFIWLCSKYPYLDT